MKIYFSIQDKVELARAIIAFFGISMFGLWFAGLALLTGQIDIAGHIFLSKLLKRLVLLVALFVPSFPLIYFGDKLHKMIIKKIKKRKKEAKNDLSKMQK